MIGLVEERDNLFIWNYGTKVEMIAYMFLKIIVESIGSSYSYVREVQH
jgi:hypothetical protein